ncbi:hypothetical protein GSI_09464 [Ganoderma sinense ZZ0214-1]|uniref:Uncharacterized protein n=1 Tax=Ganoderma sinense ZZ0214-1 TaxID=1077348 RepID=A0A2G8S6K6_9APHY|nr:hypothetical protein GSI_09464 [Ganoderma sinense ZZ0214-1]
MATTRPADITYGPTMVIAAKAIMPVKRSSLKLTEEQRVEMARRNTERNDCIEDTIREVYKFAEDKAKYLSETCGKKDDYYLRLIFSGGEKLGKGRKVNAYNAWSHQLAKEKNAEADPGEASNLLELQQEYRDEYDKLTPAQKMDLCAMLMEERDSRTFGVRVNQKGRTLDVMNTFWYITAMLLSLKCRCGIEAFVGVVRNNTEYDLRPQWFFTSSTINRYLTGAIKKWDVEVIGSQMEVFSIAGCEIFTFLQTNRDRAEWMKNEIREKMNAMYSEAIGQKGLTMQYKNFEQTVAIGHGLDLVGWTHDVFANPASLPASIEPLRKLLNALDIGDCHFVQLSHAERERCRLAFQEQVDAGAVKMRKSCSDKGKKRQLYTRRNGDAHLVSTIVQQYTITVVQTLCL